MNAATACCTGLAAMVFDLAVHFPVMALAANLAAETIRHGSIFSDFRARLEARGGFLSDLVGCGFCLIHITPKTGD